MKVTACLESVFGENFSLNMAKFSMFETDFFGNKLHEPFLVPLNSVNTLWAPCEQQWKHPLESRRKDSERKSNFRPISSSDVLVEWGNRTMVTIRLLQFYSLKYRLVLSLNVAKRWNTIISEENPGCSSSFTLTSASLPIERAIRRSFKLISRLFKIPNFKFPHEGLKLWSQKTNHTN